MRDESATDVRRDGRESAVFTRDVCQGRNERASPYFAKLSCSTFVPFTSSLFVGLVESFQFNLQSAANLLVRVGGRPPFQTVHHVRHVSKVTKCLAFMLDSLELFGVLGTLATTSIDVEKMPGMHWTSRPTC